MSQIVAVAFDLNQRFSAEIFTGISDYVRAQNLDWKLIPMGYGFESKLMELAQMGKLDAVIGTFVSDRWVESLTANGINAVNIFNFSEIRLIDSVTPDDLAIGGEAALHLQNQSAEDLLFYAEDGLYATQLRHKGFIEGSQRPVARCDQMGQAMDILAGCAERGTKLGVFCANDRLARKFILAAELKGYAVQKHFCILGVENDPAESIFAGVDISSFQLPVMEIGQTAAARLQARMTSHSLPAEHDCIPQHRLIERASSITSPTAQAVQRACVYMEANFANPALSVDLIAQQTGVSRRSLELHFKQHRSESPYQTLSRIRKDAAVTLLRQTRHPIMEVGRLCGYPEVHHFSVWFKKQSGHSPKQFRQLGQLAD